jgi:hypothetical protein
MKANTTYGRQKTEVLYTDYDSLLKEISTKFQIPV